MSDIASREHRLFLACSAPEPARERQDQVRRLVREGVDWGVVLSRVRRHGTTPLLHVALEAVGWDMVPVDIKLQLERYQRVVAMKNLHLGNEMKILQEAFIDRSIGALFFKGPILALDAYGGMGMRHSGDVDVLIAPDDFGRAEEVLREQEFIPFTKIQRLGPMRRAAHLKLARQIPYRKRLRADVDLHIGVVGLGHHFSLGFSTMNDRARIFAVGANQIRTFSVEDTFLVLCYQGVNNRWIALKHICDVGAFVGAHAEMDWDLILQSVKKMNGQRVILHALDLARSICEMKIPTELASAILRDRTVKQLSETVVTRLRSEDVRDLTFRERMTYYPAIHPTLIDKGRYVVFSIARRLLSPSV